MKRKYKIVDLKINTNGTLENRWENFLMIDKIMVKLKTLFSGKSLGKIFIVALFLQKYSEQILI